MEFSHVPVLLDECLELLNIQPGGTYIDGTLGGAGHSSHILSRLGKGGQLIGIDQDAEALEVASRRLNEVETSGTFRTIKSNFADMKTVCEGVLADGILLDIGVSSYQFDNPERGFSYRTDAKLDMRMDREGDLTAYDVVNTYTERELIRILRDYGEEKWAIRIAKFIVAKRKEQPIETTFQLADLVKDAIPAAARKEGGHPAKRTFQAIRIEVNRELAVLEEAIDGAMSLLKDGGRLVIITFHSLEDRIVKNKFREAERPCVCPSHFPVCVCGRESKGRIVTGHPVVAKEEE
ncbi:MAG: 16S rRNA (cytosine(1402)-N(4))-methyltransferase RsmH, partial [Clostridia bacterium]|nr:16S rRNA (cytosine(1402)-N(4))-methyltransferase RsmH [Clostridia bacterium]